MGKRENLFRSPSKLTPATHVSADASLQALPHVLMVADTLRPRRVTSHDRPPQKSRTADCPPRQSKDSVLCWFRGDKCPLRTNSYQALCISDLTPFPAQWNEPGFLIQREGSQISNLHIWFVMGQDRNLVSAALRL